MTKLIAVFCASLLLTMPCWADDIHQTQPANDILQAARLIMQSDPNAALITVDSNGQPRARTVTTSAPEDDMTVWVATKPNTRKVEQIKGNANVTLYFSRDDAYSYVSLMGTATLHADTQTIADKNFYAEKDLYTHWPDFPKDFLLIKITPTWIEVEGHGISGRSDTWQPQGVELGDLTNLSNARLVYQ